MSLGDTNTLIKFNFVKIIVNHGKIQEDRLEFGANVSFVCVTKSPLPAPNARDFARFIVTSCAAHFKALRATERGGRVRLLCQIARGDLSVLRLRVPSIDPYKRRNRFWASSYSSSNFPIRHFTVLLVDVVVVVVIAVSMHRSSTRPSTRRLGMHQVFM